MNDNHPPRNKNAKNPAFSPPVSLPGAHPDEYQTDEVDLNPDSRPGSRLRPRQDQEGTDGFDPKLSGNGKAGRFHTSGFDTEPGPEDAS